MASISNDGKGAGAGDALARLRDHYANREKDIETRHREEIQDIRETHRAEMDKLRDETQKRVQNAQEESNVKLNQKDVQYQKEIEALRSMYAKRLAEAKKPVD